MVGLNTWMPLHTAFSALRFAGILACERGLAFCSGCLRSPSWHSVGSETGTFDALAGGVNYSNTDARGHILPCNGTFGNRNYNAHNVLNSNHIAFHAGTCCCTASVAQH